MSMLKPCTILLLKDLNHARVYLICFSHNRRLPSREMCASRLHELIRDPAPLNLNQTGELDHLLPTNSKTAAPALPSRFTKVHGDARYPQYAEQWQFEA